MANSDSLFEKLVKFKNWDWSSYSTQKTSESNQFGSGHALDIDSSEPVAKLATWELKSPLIMFGGEDTVSSSLNKSSGSQWGLDDDSTRNPHFQPNLFIPEKWESSFSLDAQVYQFDKASVYCDCFVNPDEQQFEKRVFPRQLFEHLFELKVGSLVVIKIRSKQGAMRIDVTDGRGIVSPEIFDMESKWDSLKGF